MPDIPYVILGRNDGGEPIRVGVTDSGETDGVGNPIYVLSVKNDESLALLGAADDEAGDPTVIGLLKGILAALEAP